MRVSVYILLLLTGFLGSCTGLGPAYNNDSSTAGSQRLIPDNIVYDSKIKSVQFYSGSPNMAPSLKSTYPVLYMGDPTPLTLEFDELIPPDQMESDFFADLINCDADWNLSNVLPIEFFNGFSQKPITLFRQSEYTKVPYTHYTFTFPFENNSFKLSGNYILKVYRNNSNSDLVLTRRFLVLNPQIGVNPVNRLESRIERQRLVQYDFEVNTGKLPIIDPGTDLKIRILRNFRWDDAYEVQRPTFFGNESYRYEVNLNRIFQGGNEFRFHDIRSTRMKSESVDYVDLEDGRYFARLYPDQRRTSNVFRGQRDLNGVFWVEGFEWPQHTFQADYIRSDFRLQSSPVEGDVYVWGGLTDWKLRPEFKMNYNEVANRYELSVDLKQGVYDYKYVVAASNGQIDETYFEGTSLANENFYNILVYYREPSDRSDRLLGYLPVNYYE